MNTRCSSWRAPALLVLAGVAACGAPSVAPGLDTLVCPADGGACVLPPTPGSIEGSVVYTGTRRGDVILFLFNAKSLPPPDGTATSAVSLARIPANAFFGGRSGAGPFSAPYTFSQVPPGSYQIRGFIDAAGEFDPFFDFLQQPRAGNPTGGHVEFGATGVPFLASFEVPAGGVARAISVAMGLEALFDPPSFQYAQGTPTSFSISMDRPQTLTLETVNLGFARASFQKARFAVELDRGADGLSRISDGDGLVDVYPKILLRQTEALQQNGTLVPVSGEAQAIVPCKVNPLPFLPQLLASTPLSPPIGAVRVQVLVQSLAVKLINGTPQPLSGIPAGYYQLVVINKSGQVWTMPNALAQQGVASQSIKFEFAVTSPPPGAISGKVTYPAGRVNGNLIVQAYKGGPQFAPPLSASTPVRVKLIPKRFLVVDPVTHKADYTIDGLPNGNYTVLALDDGDGNFSGFNILQTPTKGDLVGGVLDALGHFSTIAVQGGKVTGKDVTLLSAPGQDGAGAGMPLDPPAFELDEERGPAQLAQDARGTLRITAQAKALAFPAGNGSDATTFFTVGLVRDANGNTVDSDGDGLPDVWPRAILVKLDENDPAGLTQAMPTTVIPAAVDPTPFLPALLAANAPSVLPVKTLSIVVRPAALDATNAEAPVRLAAMPTGRYKIVLLNKTGQLWQVPNEAGPAALDAGSICTEAPCATGTVSTASQSRSFKVVPPAVAVPSGSIAGTLKILGGGTADSKVHAAYVFAFRAEDPPPPLGTGKPVSADVHLGNEIVTAGADKTVAFTLRALAAGDYYVLGVADTRGDFALDPFLFAAAPGPGTLAGGHIDASQKLARITVGTSAVTGQDVVLTTTGLPPRPSFIIADANGFVPGSDLAALTTTSVAPTKLRLVSRTLLDASVSVKPEPANSAAFLVELQCDAAGRTLDADFDNLPDVYPTIRLVKLDPNDPTGMTYDTSSGGLIAIPAAVDPTPFFGNAGLSCGGARKKVATDLSVLVSPAAVLQTPGLPVQPLGSIPAGRYGVVAIQGTGQVWRVPNELQPSLLDPRTFALAPAAAATLLTQGLAIAVTVGAPLPGVTVSGQILFTHYAPADVGNVLVAAYRAVDPPPPAGTGRPVSVRLIPRPYLAQAALAGRLAYSLGGLAEDTYLIAAMHDQQDRFNPILSFMATPGALAQVSFIGGAAPAPIAVGAVPLLAPDLFLDQDATQALPFERPMFEIDAATNAMLPGGATAPIGFRLQSVAPSALPNGLVLQAGGGVIEPAFHPRLVLDGTGQPVKTSDGRFAVTTKVLVTPLVPSARGVVALVDPRPFCTQLVTGADAECTTGTPILADGVPVVATTTSLTMAALHNVSLDLATKAIVGGRPPTGSYRITAIEFTGQSWSIPNELSGSGGTDGAAQGGVFVVQ